MEGRAMKYFVDIKRNKTKTIEKSIECSSERTAEKVERGVNINLNHKEYYTIIRKEETSDVKA